MEMSKIFTCQSCDEEIEIADVYNTDTVLCHNCGEEYRVRFVEREEAWELIPIEPVEKRSRSLAEEEEEEPFQVLGEEAAPRKDDYDRY